MAENQKSALRGMDEIHAINEEEQKEVDFRANKQKAQRTYPLETEIRTFLKIEERGGDFSNERFENLAKASGVIATGPLVHRCNAISLSHGDGRSSQHNMVNQSRYTMP